MPTVSELVRNYRDERDNLALKRKEYKEAEATAKRKMAEIAMQLRELSDQLGVNSFATDHGTAYRVENESFRVGNWDEVLDFIKATGNYQMLEKRIAKLATKEIFDDTKVLPPGVEYEKEVDFVVRKN
jgi:hypothetical protein